MNCRLVYSFMVWGLLLFVILWLLMLKWVFLGVVRFRLM